MDDKPGPRVLKFELFASCVSVDFWMTLSKKKLETFGLDASAKRISGSYTTGNSSTVSSRLDVTYDAFDDEKQHSHTLTYPAEGKLLLFNTIEAFRDCDKQQLADQEGALLWTLITSGEALEHPSMLTNFFLAGYADLKKHVYRYWFLFPAVVYPDALVHESEPLEITKIFSKECVENISDFSHRLSHEQNAFLIHQDDASFELFHLRDLPALLSKTGKITLCVCDGSAQKDNPGWPARNILALYAYYVRSHAQHHRIQLVSLRKRVLNGQTDIDHSIVMDLRVVFTPDQIREIPQTPRTVGWERDEKGRLQPRMVDLSSQMDPQKLAEQAVALNLKLMKWRLVPQLDLTLLHGTKVLLLGSGTLGCNVARCLMGWGMMNLTFVDNARVSYSNPVRQSLFTFDDCIENGLPKSQAAVQAVKRIYPGVNARGVQMNIPMPGHSVPTGMRKEVVETITQLERLIDESHVVFLLMDTRESRWLPTVIAAAKEKGVCAV
ncbi:hypothetical protein RvY_03179-2 [Ramazzottius varieornatus]|uniref:Ubiquitin-like modifier-activating enzyme ATG7 n=1 Tax=Ramazzottius varieornatus TaxID=947166 RepID=A0A1D1UQX7_RAMVA|nr:hypothetical protein RvY_03179-2 [Ramazzottius varieornatus]